MEKGEREVRERKGRGVRRGEGEKGAMGVDPTKFHNREIPCRAGSLFDSNFITRMLYSDCY